MGAGLSIIEMIPLTLNPLLDNSPSGRDKLLGLCLIHSEMVMCSSPEVTHSWRKFMGTGHVQKMCSCCTFPSLILWLMPLWAIMDVCINYFLLY